MPKTHRYDWSSTRAGGEIGRRIGLKTRRPPGRERTGSSPVPRTMRPHGDRFRTPLALFTRGTALQLFHGLPRLKGRRTTHLIFVELSQRLSAHQGQQWRAVTKVPVLASLTYMSSAVGMPTQSEIDHLLTRARARNFSEHVTGILLHAEGSFLQVIEGPTESIARVYSRILSDPMHHNILELLHEPIVKREFAQWSMAYRVVGLRGIDPRDELSAKLDAPPGDLSAVHHLIAAFWNRGLGPRYGSVMHEATRHP